MSNEFFHPTFKLRYVERNGERILQFSTYCRIWTSMHGYSDPQWSGWTDVMVEVEEPE
jgi:hypothetical protein